MNKKELINDYEFKLSKVFMNEKIKILTEKDLLPEYGICFSVHFIEKEFYNFYRPLEEMNFKEEILKPIYNCYKWNLIIENINVDSYLQILEEE